MPRRRTVPSPTRLDIAATVRSALTHSGLTQSDVAQQMKERGWGSYTSTMSRTLQDTRSVRLEEWFDLADILGVDGFGSLRPADVNAELTKLRAFKRSVLDLARTEIEGE